MAEGTGTDTEDTNSLNTSLENTEHLNSQASFTARQPDITQASASAISVVNTEVSNAIDEPFTPASVNLSDIIVVLNGRVLVRPPLATERQILRGRSATPIRIPHDPLRPRRARSESPVRYFRELDWSRMVAASEAGRSDISNVTDESTLDDFFVQRARLRSTRRPMFDGDSVRNLAGRRIFFGNLDNGVGIQFITVRPRFNGLPR